MPQLSGNPFLVKLTDLFLGAQSVLPCQGDAVHLLFASLASDLPIFNARSRQRELDLVQFAYIDIP